MKNTLPFSVRELSQIRLAKKDGPSYFVIIRGSSGVGKTTIAIALARLLNGYVISFDDILAEYNLDRTQGEPCVSEHNMLVANKIVIPVAQKKLSAGYVVVFDGNFYHKKQIDDLINNIRFPHIIFTLKADLGVCLARNKKRANPLEEQEVKNVFALTSKFDGGFMIDATDKTVQEILDEITRFIKMRLT